MRFNSPDYASDVIGIRVKQRRFISSGERVRDSLFREKKPNNSYRFNEVASYPLSFLPSFFFFLFASIDSKFTDCKSRWIFFANIPFQGKLISDIFEGIKCRAKKWSHYTREAFDEILQVRCDAFAVFAKLSAESKSKSKSMPAAYVSDAARTGKRDRQPRPPKVRQMHPAERFEIQIKRRCIKITGFPAGEYICIVSVFFFFLLPFLPLLPAFYRPRPSRLLRSVARENDERPGPVRFWSTGLLC